MQKAPANVLSSNPTNINEVYKFINTAELGESFLLHNEKNNDVILFSSGKNLRFLSRVEDMYVNCTFKNSARFFDYTSI